MRLSNSKIASPIADNSCIAPQRIKTTPLSHTFCGRCRERDIAMFSYILGGLAILVLFFDPISQLLSPGAPRIVRTPLPRELNEDLLALESAHHNNSACPPDAYSVRIFSKAPLVIYIENFLSPEERAHLLEIRLPLPGTASPSTNVMLTYRRSDPLFEASTVTHDGGDSTDRNTTIRDSEVAMVPRTTIVRCIEARARALQGWRDEVWVERLRVQRYRHGGHYSHHFDWSTGRGGWGRVSSFMAWVADDDGALEGGGTEFPLLGRWTGDGRWCAFVECGGEGDEAEGRAGTTFKPVAGNAIFWENFRPDGTGRGYEESWHAGLPVQKGTKVGLNIWSWGWID